MAVTKKSDVEIYPKSSRPSDPARNNWQKKMTGYNPPSKGSFADIKPRSGSAQLYSKRSK